MPFSRHESRRLVSYTSNAGVADALVTNHGRWASQKFKQKYTEYSIKSKLLVSKNLGL